MKVVVPGFGHIGLTIAGLLAFSLGDTDQGDLHATGSPATHCDPRAGKVKNPVCRAARYPGYHLLMKLPPHDSTVSWSGGLSANDKGYRSRFDSGHAADTGAGIDRRHQDELFPMTAQRAMLA